METIKVKKNLKFKALCYGMGLASLLVSHTSWAQTVVIQPNTVISSSKTYNNVTLDMNSGSFIIKNHATLTIENCVIDGKLSKNNPTLINVEDGNITLKNDTVTIKTSGLTQHPYDQSLQYVMRIGQGGVNLNQNVFTIDNPFTAGLLVTTESIPTTGFQITNNKFEKFHGVLYLIASDNALVQGNEFLKDTYGNMVNFGNNNKIIGNRFFFSGNDHLGNSIDIIDSDNVTVSKNQLFTPTCHGIYVLSSHNLKIEDNTIEGGITYGVYIISFPEVAANQYLTKIVPVYKQSLSNNITISHNYMAQNRYGVAASDTDKLTVENNTFIQHFTDEATRKFWTDNKTLLKNVTDLTWEDNLYKEAFTQENGGDNSKALSFVTFPKTGGVTL